MRAAAIAGALTIALGSRAAAQGDCFPGAESNEAKTLAIFSVPLAFGPAGAPLTRGRISVGIEAVYLPNVDPATATPTVCRPGKGPENTDLLFAAPRPRVSVALGGGLTLEGSWIPPIRLNQVSANLFGIALGWTTALGGTHRLTLRGHGTFGRVRAPITCDDAALADPLSECYQGTRSDDRYRPNIVGADATVSWSLGGGRVQPYLGAGYNRLMPRFQVDFTNVAGQRDERRVEVDLDRAVLFGGATWWPAGGRLGLSGELYAAPSDAITGRVAVRLAVGS
ncbi:MAG: hypothetical protein AB7R55_01280 [Gemmatimonadales bacterium]